MTVIEKIIVALKEHGPMTAGQLTEKLPTIDYLSTALSQGVRRGKLKRSGAYRKQVYAIGNGKAPVAATPQDRQPPHKGRNAKHRNANGARPRTAAESELIAAITHDHRVVLIEGGAVKVYSPEQTSAIADLMLANFEAE